MFEILSKKTLADGIRRIVVNAPYAARKARAGQFVVIMLSEYGERIPLTIVETDGDSLTLIFQEAGKTTMELGALKTGDKLADVLGPLGQPTVIEDFGRVITVGGGVGVAEVYPVSKALKAAGNRVVSVIGARSKNLLILEKEMRAVTDNLYVATDDGSYGIKGNVGDILKDLIVNIRPDLVYAIGPVPMMRAVSDITKVHDVKTLVSLNPIMVDGTGMCGACRINVGGQTRFSCVDGPEFDAHEVDWDELSMRLRLFKIEEARSIDHYCRLKALKTSREKNVSIE
ncbi:MAG: ferredoxin-NADP reductase [Elusimicrobia bacterium HGW-Elusimicrobia-1]|jgi:ferredoxin--NADP+ reductase|nr:MAG: ferredoxin-NADP reductase [Elusimicrobia bacterium HGW-Elusimicrobia-1]